MALLLCTEKMKKRTHQQNGALQQYFERVADTSNNEKLDMRTLLKPDIAIPRSTDTVKEFIWEPMQKIQFGEDSTFELSVTEAGQVCDALNRYLAERGVHAHVPATGNVILW